VAAREVIFAPEALADLQGLYDAIAEGAAPARALAWVEQVRAYCQGLATFPERGMRRDDLRPGLRTIGYRRRVTVAFHVTAERVVIDRILYAGRDLEGPFRRGAEE
jgi:toxin ParE1/3/4